MSVNSRRKGKDGELEAAKILKSHGYDCHRSVQFNGWQGEADVVGLPGIHIEVKRVENLNVEKALQQAERDTKNGDKPIVLHRRNRESWKVTMRFDDWIELYKAWEVVYASDDL